MIFSNKVYKIIDGENVSLFAQDENSLFLYIYDKSLKKYRISENLNKNCVFCKNYNYKKIIQLDINNLAACSNGYITITNENEI